MKSLFLQKDEIEGLIPIYTAVNRDDSSLSDLICIAERAQEKLRGQKFPFIYLGILLAKKNKVEDAITILETHAGDDAFSQALVRILKERKQLIPSTQAFADTRPYSVWTKTSHYQHINKVATEAILQFLQKLPDPNLEKCTLLDIGTGNGVFISRVVNELAERYGLKKIHLILIDQFHGMLSTASECIRQTVPIKTEITPVEGRIQDMNPDQVAFIKNHSPIWFGLASLSLHHMPAHQKISTLKQIAAFTNKLMIVDVEANHDLPEADTPEFIFSLVGHCDYYVADVMTCHNLSLEEKYLCIDHFILGEAIVMMIRPRAERIDYHAPLKQWEEHATSSGWQNVLSRHLTSTPDGRPLIFGLGLAQ